MTRTMRSAQAERDQDRDARLARARQRRMALDQDREARDARIDQAMADVYLAQDRRAAATTAIADADALAAEAIGRLMAEGLVLAQVVELTEMPSRHVQRLRSAVDAAPGPAAKPAVNRNSGEPVSLAAGPSKGVDGADTPPPGAVSSGVS